MNYNDYDYNYNDHADGTKLLERGSESTKIHKRIHMTN